MSVINQKTYEGIKYRWITIKRIYFWLTVRHTDSLLGITRPYEISVCSSMPEIMSRATIDTEVRDKNNGFYLSPCTLNILTN